MIIIKYKKDKSIYQINIFVSKAVRHLPSNKYNTCRRKSDPETIQFSAMAVALVSDHEFRPNPPQKSCPSRRDSRAWKQNLIREFRCWNCGGRSRRERDREERGSGEFEKRRALTSFVFTFYGRQSKGSLFPGCFHDCLSSPFSCYQCLACQSSKHRHNTRGLHARAL